MTYDDVCAIVVTKDEASTPTMPAIRESLKHYGEVIVWDNATYLDRKIMGRYDAALKTDRPVVYFQDDDVLLPRKAHDALLAEYAPGLLVSNMFDSWIEAQGYFDLALVGLGSIQDKGLWEEPFARFIDAYGWDADRMLLDPDFIYGTLAKWRRFDFDAEACILPLASDASRLSLQPGQHERKFETIDMTRKLRTVVLTIMAKNEADQIGRALTSAAPWYDRVLLLDTGSEDNTIVQAEVICGIHGKPIDVIEAPFTTFQEMRNLLLSEGRQRGDYMLLMDADEEWVEVSERPPLWAEAYMIHYDGPVDYAHPRLIASRFPWKFSGERHSYLDSDWDGECMAVNLPTPRIVHHGDQRHGETKVEADIAWLEEEITKTETDIHRNLFLLGKAYDGTGQFDLAIDAYRRRIELGSLDEEDYWCRLRLGNLLAEHSNDMKGAIETLWEAYQVRPSRVEALRAISFYCTAVADATPYPEDDITLVLRNMYRVT